MGPLLTTVLGAVTAPLRPKPVDFSPVDYRPQEEEKPDYTPVLIGVLLAFMGFTALFFIYKTTGNE